ncbi:MAG: DeoR/GlpR transcriptional regulator [Clostridia bacterium]|nr:DeoR/GlpR transcriptional regulator [Clostridia bacterium]
MKTNEREKQILELLQEQRFASVTDLAAALYTSPSSIRRDLTHMQSAGLVRRNYGGVVLCDREHTPTPASVRLEENKATKKQIARKASAFLHDNMTVFLDGSTTVSYMAEYFAEFQNITVFTNNLRTASQLIERSVDTYCIGGRSVLQSHVMGGSYAEDMIRNLHADIVFFSSFALSDDGVISDCTMEENALRKLMLARSDCRVFLCDSSKFHRFSTHRLCSVDEIEHCVFDQPPKP